VKKEPDTRAHQLLAQSAILASLDLGALIIEVLILNERAELGAEKVIETGKRIERQVCVICSATSVDWDSTSHGVHNLDPGRFGIVTSDARADIRLPPLISRRESQDEVHQERARIDPGGHVTLCYKITIRFPQREVGATAKAIVKEVAFNRWTNYARAKDVTEFNAPEKANVILRRDLQSGTKIPIGLVDKAVVTVKRSVAAAVLIDVRAHVDRTVKTESIHWWWWWRRDLLVDFRSGLQRSGNESDQYSS